MYIYVYIYVYICRYICIYICIHLCLGVYVYMYIYIYCVGSLTNIIYVIFETDNKKAVKLTYIIISIVCSKCRLSFAKTCGKSFATSFAQKLYNSLVKGFTECHILRCPKRWWSAIKAPQRAGLCEGLYEGLCDGMYGCVCE